MLPLKGHEQRIRCLAFSPDGTQLASCANRSHTIWVWDVRTTPVSARLSGHRNEVLDFAFAPHQALLASVARYDEVLLWPLGPGIPAAAGRLRSRPALVSGLTFRPDGQGLAVAG